MTNTYQSTVIQTSAKQTFWCVTALQGSKLDHEIVSLVGSFVYVHQSFLSSLLRGVRATSCARVWVVYVLVSKYNSVKLKASLKRLKNKHVVTI